MADIRGIRQRIRSIGSTEKITRAMRMVAAAKLAGTQKDRAESEPYYETLGSITRHLLADEHHYEHPLLTRQGEGTHVLVIFSSNRGLCGGYNLNLFRLADHWLAERNDAGEPVVLMPLGHKAREHFGNNPATRLILDVGPTDRPSYEEGRILTDTLVKLYLEEKTASVTLLYTRFHSAIRQEAALAPLFPLEADKGHLSGTDYIFEPDSRQVVERILPRYVETLVYRALLESKTSEHAARMTAMDSASRAARDMIRDLTVQLNRARQEAITMELAEIVGGVEALKRT